MLYRLAIAAALGLAALTVSADAQTAQVVPDCAGVAGVVGPGGRLYTDQSGRLCTAGVLVASPSAMAAGGLATYRVNSPAGAAAMMVKASPGRVYSFNLCNTAGASRYVRFYNSASPTVGTTPVFAGAIVIGAGTCQQFTTNFGLTFSNGIGLGITAANGDSDTTPVAAGDVSGFIGYL